MSILTSIIKASGSEYASIAADGIVAGDVVSYIDTGSYTLNAVISGSIFGGLPSNKITAFAGEEATGKTFFALSVAKQFLDADPLNHIVYFESESAISKEMLEERQLDTSRMAFVSVTTVEQFKHNALAIVDHLLAKHPEENFMFILDSLGNLSTNKEMDDSASGKDTKDMTRTQVIKAAFRVLTLKMGRANIPMIVTNHVYEAIGQKYADKVVSGGSGLKYAASTILTLSKAKARMKDMGGKTTELERIGSIITVKAAKSRLTIEETKVKTILTFDSGLDRYYGLWDIALEAGLIVIEGKRYHFFDREGTVFKKDVLGNPEKFWTQDVLEQIDEWIQYNFTYKNLTSEEINEALVSEAEEQEGE